MGKAQEGSGVKALLQKEKHGSEDPPLHGFDERVSTARLGRRALQKKQKPP
jgi:hypothetical protein